MNDFKSYQKKYLLSSQWKGSVNVKLELASPYNFFLTRVEELPSTHNQDLTIMFPGTFTRNRFYYLKMNGILKWLLIIDFRAT